MVTGTTSGWDRHSVHTNQVVFIILTWREGTSIVCRSLIGREWPQTPLAVALAWFRIPRTCCSYINQVTVFQGQSGVLNNMSFHLLAGGCSFHVPNLLHLLKGQLPGFVPKLGNQLSDCQGGREVSMPYELGHGRL